MESPNSTFTENEGTEFDAAGLGVIIGKVKINRLGFTRLYNYTY